MQGILSLQLQKDEESPPDSLGKEAVEVSWAVGNEHFQSCLKSGQLEGKKGRMSDGREEMDVVGDGRRKRTDVNVYSGTYVKFH